MIGLSFTVCSARGGSGNVSSRPVSVERSRHRGVGRAPAQNAAGLRGDPALKALQFPLSLCKQGLILATSVAAAAARPWLPTARHTGPADARASQTSHQGLSTGGSALSRRAADAPRGNRRCPPKRTWSRGARQLAAVP